MGKIKPAKKLTNPGGGNDFKNNPFADLKSIIKVPEVSAIPPTQTPIAGIENTPAQRLSQADQDLLKAFSEVSDIEIRGKGEIIQKRPKISLRKEKKGHGGKTVIVVNGLANLSLEEQMELCKQIKKGLGTGARFEDHLLLIQGDQEERIKNWFIKEEFRF